MTMVLGIGLFTPPVGQTLYISALVAQAPIEVVSRDILWFLAAIVFVVLLGIFYLPTTLDGRGCNGTCSLIVEKRRSVHAH